MVKRVISKSKSGQKNLNNQNKINKKRQSGTNNQEDFANDGGEVKGNNAEFYLDDADLELADDEIEEKENISASDDGGSELDFGEDDYIESEDEEEKEYSETKVKREKKITKIELKKIIKKCKDGNPIGITKMIIIFTKITSPNYKTDSLDEDDIFNKPKIVQKLLKFCLRNLVEILVLKLHSITPSGLKEKNLNQKTSVIKNLIRRYLSALCRYTKNTENQMLAYIFKNISSLSELIFEYKNKIEVFLKLSVKIWASRHGYTTSNYAFNFIKDILQKRPEYFENALKYFYINYLETAKAMNWNTIQKIRSMQDELIKILSFDLQKAYITIFTFIRKLCLQLRMTIMDKKSSSIKNIYNWQFINSLKLWSRVISTYFNNKNSEINLLAYPLIQTILGVLRLNLVDTFFPLRIYLCNMLNEISHATNIYTPVSTYILEILESSLFKSKYKEKNVTSNEKDSCPDINVNLKFKNEEFKNYGYVFYILDESIDSLCEFLSLNSYKYSFPEIAFPVMYQLKKISKNIMVKLN
jgi:nucleolar complex protein 2